MAYQVARYEKQDRIAVLTIKIWNDFEQDPEVWIEILVPQVEGPRAFAEKRKPNWKAR